MTVKELLAQEPYLRTDEEQTGIYLVPGGKFGFTSFPVGTSEVEVVEVENELPEDFKMPEGISEEEQHQILYHEDRREQFILDENAVLVTPEQYQGIMTREYCFQDGKAVKYVEPKTVADAKALVKFYEELSVKRQAAQDWLNGHDYIGVKISEAMLLGTDEEVDALRTEYADMIAEAKVQRAVINDCDTKLASQKDAYEKAQKIIIAEN